MGYYMGDYYRGDPGIGSFLGGLVKKAVSFIPGIGPIASGAIDVFAKKPTGIAKVAATGGAIIKAGKGIIMKHPVITAAGAAGIGGVLAGAGGSAILHHRGAAAAGGRRRRRMNVCNPKALRRSIRRTHGFAKLAMRTIHLVHPKKKVRFGGFKKRKSHK